MTMSMKALLIETCTERPVIALSIDDTIHTSYLPEGHKSSSLLMPALQKLLKQYSVQPHELDLIAVGSGPGSYTGIRVGVAVAKVLSYTHKIPLVSISSLYGLIPDHDGPYAAFIDARIGGAYFILAERKGETINYLTDPDVADINTLKQLLIDVPTFVTPASEQLQKRFEGIDADWKWIETAPNPTQLLHIAKQKHAAGDFSIDGSVDILYLRKTQAEIEREAKENPIV